MEKLLTPKQAGHLIGKNAGFTRDNYRTFGGFLIGKRKYFTEGGISHALQNAKRADSEGDKKTMKHQAKSPSDALLYITDCCLATVSSMAMLKSKKKGEYSRQIGIAQKACDWIREMGLDPSGTRAEDIVGKQTVQEWAEQYEPKPADSEG